MQPLLSRACYHVKGHGGLRGAVRDVWKHYSHYRFFCKTDAKSYYDSIDHLTLMMKLYDHVSDHILMVMSGSSSTDASNGADSIRT